MKAYIESIFARKHYLAEKINGDHSKLLATILADDGFLTCGESTILVVLGKTTNFVIFAPIW